MFGESMKDDGPRTWGNVRRSCLVGRLNFVTGENEIFPDDKIPDEDFFF